MFGKLLALWTLALCAQVSLGQNSLGQAGLNLQGSASLGYNPDIGRGIANGIQLLQNGVSAVENGLNSHGQHVQQIANNVAVSAQRLTSHVSEQLDKILQDLKEKAIAAANEASKRVDEAVESASQVVDKVQEKASEVGQDISECTKDNVDLEQVRARAKDLVLGCVTEKIQQAVSLINRIQSAANDAIATTQNVDSSIARNCRGLNTLAALRCKAGVASNSAANMSNITAEILSVISEASALGGNIKIDLEVCLAQRVALAALDAGKVALKVAACVRDKQTADNSDVDTDNSVSQEVSL